MFQVLFDQLLQVINFVGLKILTINIAGVQLLYWVIIIVLITGIITLIFSLRPKANIIRHSKKERDKDE